MVFSRVGRFFCFGFLVGWSGVGSVYRGLNFSFFIEELLFFIFEFFVGRNFNIREFFA